MPKFDVGTTLVDPSSMLTDGTKYSVQNQGGYPVRFRRHTAAFTAADPDSLLLGGTGDETGQTPTHLEYTYAAADHIRLWTDVDVTVPVVFHALE